MIIYKLTSPSGKVYIGQSKYDLETRWQQHLWLWQVVFRSEHKIPTKLHHAFTKYEPGTWTKEIILECDQENASFHEKEEIEKHDSFRNGYNMTLGGEGLNGADFSELHRAGIAKAKKLWWDSPEGMKQKQVLSERYKQYNPGAEASRGRLAWNSGISVPPPSPATRAKISAAHKGRPKSAEHRAKLSEVRKGKKQDPEFAKRRTEATRGFKQTDFQKEAVRKANSAQWQVTYPDGKIETIENLNAFCKEHKLDQGNLSRGKHKGFKATRLTEKGR